MSNAMMLMGCGAAGSGVSPPPPPPSVFWGANVFPDVNEAIGGGWIAFDWEGKIRPQIDAVRGAGGNMVRVMGNVGAVYHGDITLANYKANWTTLLDYCRAKGVYVYPCMNHPYYRASAVLGNASTAGSIVHTVVNLILGVLNSYNDVILLAVDLWNEPKLNGDATQQGLSPSDAGALYTAAKLVTAYNCTYGDFDTPADFSAGIDSGFVDYLPYCDILDFHYYTGAAVAGLDTIIAAYPGKSIFFPEYGSPLSAGSGNRVALFYKGLALGGKTNCRGSLMWTTADYDVVTSNMYGFTDASFVPYDDTVRAMVQYRPDAAIPPGVSTLFSDTFTGANNTALESHSPDTGTGWVLTSAYGTSITIYLDGSGRIKNADGTNGGLYRPVPQPSSDDFTYEIDYVMSATISNAGQDHYIGAFLRADNPPASWRYLLRILPGDGSTGVTFEVDKQVTGSYTGSIRTPTASLSLGVTYTFRCELTQEGGNVRFRFYHGIAGQQLPKIDDFTDNSAVVTPVAATRFVFYATKQIDSNFTATAVRLYSASSVPTTPTVAPSKEDVNGTPAIYWPAVIVQNFYNYRLYRGASNIYEGTLARYKNAGNTTGSYTYTVVDYAGNESAASPALVVP